MLVEMYVRLVDKVDQSAEPIRWRRMGHAGDVIEIMPSGWIWGKEEVASPDHLIVEVDVESLEKARADFCTGEILDPINNPNPLRRKAKIDSANFPALIKALIAAKDPAALRAQYAAKLAARVPPRFPPASAPALDIYALRVVKPNAVNPFVVGKDPFVVG